MIILTCIALVAGSLDEAASAGLSRIGRVNLEYAGAVLEEQDGSMCLTGLAQGHDDTAAFAVKLAPGEKLVAIFHNHPDVEHREGRWGHAGEHFSPGDIATAQRLGVKSYLRVDKTGKILKM